MNFKRDMLPNLMLICISPIYTMEDAERWGQAVTEINNRRHCMTMEMDSAVIIFLQYCELYRSTKQSAYLNMALDIISDIAEDKTEKE